MNILLFLALFTSPGYAGGYMGGTDGAILHQEHIIPNSGKPVIRN